MEKFILPDENRDQLLRPSQIFVDSDFKGKLTHINTLQKGDSAVKLLIFIYRADSGAVFQFTHFQLANFNWGTATNSKTIADLNLGKQVSMVPNFTVKSYAEYKDHRGQLVYPLNAYAGFDAYLDDLNLLDDPTVSEKRRLRTVLKKTPLNQDAQPFQTVTIDSAILETVN